MICHKMAIFQKPQKSATLRTGLFGSVARMWQIPFSTQWKKMEKALALVLAQVFAI
jgi:hypothetical protein